MSAPEFSKRGPSQASGGERARWTEPVSLVMGILAGPVAALANQQATYAANMWACGHRMHGTMHLIPALALVVITSAGVRGYLSWRALGKGVDDEESLIVTCSRFLALLAMTISAFSALVVLAQWSAIFTFDACMRA